MVRTSQILTLGDGRISGYAEWGDPEGKPVLQKQMCCLFTGAGARSFRNC